MASEKATEQVSIRRRASATGPREVARRAREQLYRTHILRAAERAFAEQGFDAAKLQDISRLAGLSMGSIYSIFPSKDAIFTSIVQDHANEIVRRVREVVAAHDDPVEALDALVREYVGYFVERPDFLRMHLRTGAAWALQPNAAPRAKTAEEIHGLHREIFARGVKQGVFLDEDPAYLARLLSGMDQIHLASWVASGMKESRDVLTERFLRVVRRTFLIGGDRSAA